MVTRTQAQFNMLEETPQDATETVEHASSHRPSKSEMGSGLNYELDGVQRNDNTVGPKWDITAKTANKVRPQDYTGPENKINTNNTHSSVKRKENSGETKSVNPRQGSFAQTFRKEAPHSYIPKVRCRDPKVVHELEGAQDNNTQIMNGSINITAKGGREEDKVGEVRREAIEEEVMSVLADMMTTFASRGIEGDGHFTMTTRLISCHVTAMPALQLHQLLGVYGHKQSNYELMVETRTNKDTVIQTKETRDLLVLFINT
eukprot:GFUD01130746.1.p1 GENE.GFUD01130746.1~~GFUD01130746.1.p1  ORF type:complete len:260 (+),score=68.67 GFUD01130746.1:105-884(+)